MFIMSPDQVRRVEERIGHARVSNEPLTIDLLDHICCMIEERVAEGMDLLSAEKDVFSRMDESRIKNIDQETTYLTKNRIVMKKRTKIVGVIAAILLLLGFTFKMMHLQGAAMLWSLGVLFTVFGFILLIFIDKFSYEKSTGDRVKHVLGYLGAAGLLLGFGFKFLEWPFATDMVYIAGFMLFIYFILNSTLTNKKLNA